MSNHTKRNQICGLKFIPLAEAEILNLPGSDSIKVSGVVYLLFSTSNHNVNLINI